MKIQEIEIVAFRGIKNLKLTPQGENLVIWGPNGTGKSGVVHAVDFLLTGTISHLEGKGTKGMSLKKHAPHIDKKPEDAYVKAIIALPDIAEPVQILRRVSNPDILETEVENCEALNLALDIARRGQHVLARRQILQYITSPPLDRAKQIQTLLNISEIESIRTNFTRISGLATKEVDKGRAALDAAKRNIMVSMGETSYEVQKILQKVNESRAVLGGGPLDELKSESLKSGLKEQKRTSPNDSNSMRTELYINTLVKYDLGDIPSIEDSLRNLLLKIMANEVLLRDLEREKLITLGLNFLNSDEEQHCPLCDTNWEKGELRKYLSSKLETAKEAKVLRENLMEHANTLSKKVRNYLAPSGCD